MWQRTEVCVSRNYVLCSSGFRAAVDYTMGLYRRVLGGRCDDVCFVESAAGCATRLTSLVEPLLTQDPDFGVSFEFCSSFLLEVSCFESNTLTCDGDEIASQRSEFTLAFNLGTVVCPDPCDNLDCGDNGLCMATDIDTAYCRCFSGWVGQRCDREDVLLFYGERYFDVELQKDPDETGLFVSTTIDIPTGLLIFNKRYNRLYIGERGYVSFGERFYGYVFDQLPVEADLALLAPLYASQDIGCGESRIFYHSYSRFAGDQLTHQVLNRMNSEINDEFDTDFEASTVIVITWYNTQPFRCTTYEDFFGPEPGNIYQLVISADSVHTYASYRYGTLNLQRYGGNVRVGHAFPAVGTVPLALSFDVIETMHENEALSVQHFALFDDTIEMTDEDRCVNWIQSTVDLSHYDNDEYFSPCPCSLIQATDATAFIYSSNPTNRLCYLSVKGVPVPGFGVAYRQCCYLYQADGQPLVAESSIYAGTISLRSGDSAGVTDDMAFDYCCQSTENDGANSYCRSFFDMRPTDDCAGFDAAISALVWGDPHIRTLDGYDYTFNGIGEYTMITLFDGSFTLQARTTQLRDDDDNAVAASKWAALAARVRNPLDNTFATVQIGMNSDESDFDILLDGQPWSSSSTGDVIFVARDDVTNFVNVTFQLGWRLDVGLAQRMLAFVITVPDSAQGNTRGLLGTFTNDVSDDLTLPDGSQLAMPQTTEQIHYNFGLEWSVNAQSSLFTYPNGMSYLDFTLPAFVPVFEAVCTAQEEQWVTDNCDGSEQCRYDYCVTKDADIAANTMQTQTNYVNSQLALNNTAPVVTVPATVNAQLGDQVLFYVTATDLEDGQIEAELIYDIDGATFDAASGEFRWTVTSADVVEIAFLARDSLGLASSSQTVVVRYCSGCSNNGVCNYDVTNPVSGSNTFRVALCECQVGWRGQHCQEDVDGCQINDCSDSQLCVDVVPLTEQASGSSYTCDEIQPCANGYERNANQVCVDIDECQTSNPCNQTCNNMIGSYTCSCQAGFTLSNDDVNCYDVNECAGVNRCDHVCTNTYGSYECSCFDDRWILEADGSCTFTGTCVPNCEQGCRNDVNICTCNSGYRLNSDGVTCDDINECISEIRNLCEHRDLCTNTAGSYNCSCPTGQQTASDGVSCVDCADGFYGDACAQQCDCSSLGIDGVWSCDRVSGCVCATGYLLNQATNTCDDVNECSPSRCGDHTECANTLGSFTCTCIANYEWDATGDNCVDIDECAVTSPCATQANSVCSNQPGGYTCECAAGFELISGVCVDSSTLTRTTLTFVITLDLNFNIFQNNAAFFGALETLLGSNLFLGQFTSNFVRVETLRYFQGSIVYQFNALFDGPLSETEISQIGQSLNEAIQNSNNQLLIDGTTAPVLGLEYAPSNNVDNSVTITNNCFLFDYNNFCGANGICDSTNNQPTCICSNGYSGDDCSVAPQSEEEATDSRSGGDDSATVIAIVLGTLGGAFVIVLIVIIAIMFNRRQNPKQPINGGRRARSNYLDDDAASNRTDDSYAYLKRAPRHYPSWYQSVWPFRHFAPAPAAYATDQYAYSNPEGPPTAVAQPIYGVYN